MSKLTTRDMHVEQTGGGCTALVRYQKDGTVLVISDGNFGHDLSRGHAVAVLFASVSDWEDSACDDVLMYHGDTAEVMAWASYVTAA